MRVALVGNPNVGKTTIFNALTGLQQEVANWSGTTVDFATGVVAGPGGADIELVDLPGTYSLTAYSQEERVTEDFLLQGDHDAVLVVADASRLERNLYLVLELLEFTPRVVVALNMVDAAGRQGIHVDPARLSRLLGVPVVPTVASQRRGLRELLAQLRQAALRSMSEPPAAAVAYPQALERAAQALAQRIAAQDWRLRFRPSWAALQLLQGDQEVARRLAALPDGAAIAGGALRLGRAGGLARTAPGAWGAPVAHQDDLAIAVADARFTRIAEILPEAVVARRRSGPDPGERLDGLLLHPFWGYLVMGLVFSLGFYLAFVASGPLSLRVDRALVASGDLAAAQLRAYGAPAYLRSLVVQGIFPGVGAVLSFVPYMAVFFAVYQFLQDSGYMARASLLVDRLMQLIGLHGKVFFALVSAFGCNVPAMTATRVMENPRDRLLANLVIPFIPCNARLGVMAVVTAAFFPGARGALAMIGLIAIGIATLAGVTAIYRRTILPQEPAPLVLELPSYHWPSVRTVLRATLYRVWLFLSRIWWFLIWATIAIWALTYFPVGLPLGGSYADQIGRWLAHVVGSRYGFDWRLMLAILFGFVAKETTLSTLGVLFGAGGGHLSLSHALAGAYPPLVGFTFLVVYMLYVPCLSTVVQMRRESGGWGWAAFGLTVNVLVAFGVGLLVERAGLLLGAGA